MGLNQLGIKPKKSLGQNFLVNEGIYRKIIAAADIKAGDTVVEIGPGLGTLTQFLLDAGAQTIAVEKDHKLADYLKTKFTDQKNAECQPQDKKNIADRQAKKLAVGAEFRTKGVSDDFELSPFGARVTIINENILKFNPERLNLLLEVQPLKSYKVVGNIPYYLTSHLLKIVFETWPAPELIVLMIQKEVAQRIVAKPPKMSLLAVSVQYYSKPKIVSYVSHGSFYPPPEVDSAIIRLIPRLQVTGYRLQEEGESKKPETWPLKPETFFHVVRAGFAEKRKQLGNNLARGLKLSKNIVEEKLESIGIEPTRRAETLTLNEWQNIATTLLPR